jgi:TfoX/Sxy family transcriptional regulator of competence genes
MASDQNFVEFVYDQLGRSRRVSFRKMFGEYAMYYDGKVVGLICDNQLFVKPTTGGRALLRHVTEGCPYPGAKPHFLIDSQLEEPDFALQLVQVTASELPAPGVSKRAAKRTARPAKPTRQP